ncbi:MAG: tRNA-dihydrouridine synthase family protein [Treponema sp.]|nr:tRNA-dihydrouridine synthase family protein [Treponema sp.]
MKLICAPMATLSHEPFRLAVERFGRCSEYYTEMINASSLLNMGPFEKYYLLNGPVPDKIVWQLTGWNAEKMAAAVPVVLEKGGIGVDINMGCSAPQIYKTGAGISWMLKPLAETEKCVSLVKKAVEQCSAVQDKSFRLSVKCRLGDEGFTEESFLNFTDMLAANGVQQIALHPRTIKEKYRGLPKYEWAEKLALRYENKIDVIVNGAVDSRESAAIVQAKVPHARGIMIARAAAVKPWIFRQLSDAASFEVDRLQLALDFVHDVEKYQPAEFYKTRIQRFFGYYCQQFAFGHYFQSQVQNYKSLEDTIKKINDYFAKQPEERLLKVN